MRSSNPLARALSAVAPAALCSILATSSALAQADVATSGYYASAMAGAAQPGIDHGLTLDLVLYTAALILQGAFCVNLFGLGTRNRDSRPGIAALCLVAAVVCAAAPAVFPTTQSIHF